MRTRTIWAVVMLVGIGGGAAQAAITDTFVQTGVMVQNERVTPYDIVTDADSGALASSSRVDYAPWNALVYIDLEITSLTPYRADLRFDQGFALANLSAYGYIGDLADDYNKYEILYHADRDGVVTFGYNFDYYGKISSFGGLFALTVLNLTDTPDYCNRSASSVTSSPGPAGITREPEPGRCKRERTTCSGLRPDSGGMVPWGPAIRYRREAGAWQASNFRSPTW